MSINQKQLRREQRVLELMGEGWSLLSRNAVGDQARLTSMRHAFEEEVETFTLLRLAARGVVKAGAVESSGRLQWDLTKAGKQAVADAVASAKGNNRPPA